MNTFGSKFRLTTFGESHAKALGGVIDGIPSGLKIDLDFLQHEINSRKSGSKFTSSRVESDKIEILSGIFEGFSTGCPIGFIIKNENQKSSHYDNLREIFRPGHADFTYFAKFGIRDHRGGGRSSARESVVRVAGGAIAQILLNEFNINVQSAVFAVGSTIFNAPDDEFAGLIDFGFAKDSEIFACNAEFETKFKDEILCAKKAKNSVGASVITQISGIKAGFGEVLYNKFDAKIAEAMMGINGVKAVEIGLGVKSACNNGYENNDFMDKNGFLSNNCGGILGGITTGQNIIIKTHFKPTPSIFLDEKTIDINENEKILSLKGRHDPCIGVRGSVVTTAMARLVCADMLLLNATSKLDNLKKIYC